LIGLSCKPFASGTQPIFSKVRAFLPFPSLSHCTLLPPQVCEALHPRIPASCRAAMVSFNDALSHAVVTERRFGRVGAPWEFNLRDVLRWCELAELAVFRAADTPFADDAVTAAVLATFPAVYMHRMRTPEDRAATQALFAEHFPADHARLLSTPAVCTSPDAVHIGVARLPRLTASAALQPAVSQPLLLREQLPAMEAAAAALSIGWMVALVGPAACGKTALARSLARLAGANLREVRRVRSLTPPSVAHALLPALPAGDDEENTLL
jgi:midasin